MRGMQKNIFQQCFDQYLNTNNEHTNTNNEPGKNFRTRHGISIIYFVKTL